MGEKFHANEYPKFSECQNADKYIRDGRITAEFLSEVRLVAENLLKHFDRDLNRWSNSLDKDLSVYTGLSGIAWLFFKLSEQEGDSQYLQKAYVIIQKCLDKLEDSRRISFFTGNTGPLALGAVLHHRCGNKNKAYECISRMKQFQSLVIDVGSDIPNEILYGRAGYLFGLLFVNKYLGKEGFEEEYIREVVLAILRSGATLAKETKFSAPLQYIWHEKYYVGAAHGYSGIFQILLEARNYIDSHDFHEKLIPALRYMMSLKFPSGNYPSSLFNKHDRLVQWCHGAPGIILCVLKLYELSGEETFLNEATSLGDVIWERGLLRKGYSICHGVTGNAYGLIALYQQTKSSEHLYRVCKFTEWVMTYNKYEDHAPDRPLSLFEGLAGIIYYLFDVLNIDSAKFPVCIH